MPRQVASYAEIRDPLNPRLVHGIPHGEAELHTVDAWCDCQPAPKTIVELRQTVILHHRLLADDVFPETWQVPK